MQPVLAQQSGGDDDGGGLPIPPLPELVLNEALSMGDVFDFQKAAAQEQPIDDVVGVIDQVLPGSTSTSRPIFESISLSDSMIGQVLPAVVPDTDLSDAINLGDVLSVSKQTVASVPRGFTDSIGVSDSIQRTFVLGNVNPNPSTPPGQVPPAPNPAPSPAPTPVGQNPPPRANTARFLVETLEVNDAPDKGGSLTAGPESTLRVVDNIAVSGLVVPPSAPIISITSPPLIELPPDGTAEITFHSTSTGTYELTIQNKDGETVRSLEGEMEMGANSVAWDGRGSSDAIASPGRYVYYIAAEGRGGAREPPEDGDGVIVLAGSPGAGPIAGSPLDPTYLIIIAIIAAAGAGLFFFLRRQKSLVMYLPAAASEVIDDMRQKYPDLVVEDYVDPNEPNLFKGVTIKNPKGADEQWLTEMAEKAKALSGVDSVNISYRGKQQTL